MLKSIKGQWEKQLMNRKMNKFISIDGQHGSGKSFLVDNLCSKLIAMGYPVVKTKEPTNSEIGLLARKAENVYSAEVLTCLFAADRMQHCQQIAEWINQGNIVVCDRYIISGLILQNMDGVRFDYISSVNCGIIKPDLSLIIYANSKNIKVRQKDKTLSRLAMQEQIEGYDRYLSHHEELKQMFNNIHFFPNNTLDDCERIIEFTIGQIEE